jgi:phage portal protein BeeE
MGAAAFLYPKESNIPLTNDELEQLRKNVHEKIRKGGVGGIEPVSIPIEILPISIDNQKYRLIEIRTQLIRELCNLFQIDSSLLNDPENKTYSNKTLALKALYTNVIIPIAYEAAYALQTRTLDYVITIETSNIELLHEDRVAQADYVIKLLQAGLITPDKAKSLLELD